jgi:hypothetical protein
MNAAQVLKIFQKGSPIVVAGKTVDPKHLDKILLKSGDVMYWVRDGSDRWISIDIGSDEIIFFTDLDEHLDPSEDLLIYQGDEYSFTFEGSAAVIDEDEEEGDQVDFKDFEHDRGEILRIMEYVVTGDVLTALGKKVPEEEIQKA